MNSLINLINEIIIGWPLILFVVGVSILCTIALKGIQFTHFLRAWKLALKPEKQTDQPAQDMTPLQAFMSTLSTSLGNGSIAGMAVAVYTGGPGSVVWVVIIGILLMSVRFAEVYLSTWYGAQSSQARELGGPMLYLSDVPGGKYLSYVYAIACLFFGFVTGSAVQANSIRVSVETTWHTQPLIVAIGLALFVYYIVSGGAARIVKVSDAVVPAKVIVFFSSTIALLAYHYASLWPALKIIFASALTPPAMVGGAIGYGLQQVIRVGMLQSIVATESGLGSAAILFGFTGSKDPMKSGLLGMITTFVSTLVCFMIVWAIVASGAWNSGLNSTALTIAAYQTLFGKAAGWIVSFLSISFGMGVMVAYGYISRAAWLFLTGGRWVYGFVIMYCASAFFGAMSDVQVVWDIINYLNAFMLFSNLFGIAWLTGKMRRHIFAR